MTRNKHSKALEEYKAFLAGAKKEIKTVSLADVNLSPELLRHYLRQKMGGPKSEEIKKELRDSFKNSSPEDFAEKISIIAAGSAKKATTAALRISQRYSQARIRENVNLLKNISNTRNDLVIYVNDMSDAFAAEGITGVKELKSFFLNWNPIAIAGTLIAIENEQNTSGITSAIMGADDHTKVKDQITDNPNISGMQRFVANVACRFVEIERGVRQIERNIKTAYSSNEIKELSKKEIPWLSETGEVRIQEMKIYSSDNDNYKEVFSNAEKSRISILKKEDSEIDNTIGEQLSLFDLPIPIKSLIDDASNVEELSVSANLSPK